MRFFQNHELELQQQALGFFQGFVVLRAKRCEMMLNPGLVLLPGLSTLLLGGLERFGVRPAFLA